MQFLLSDWAVVAAGLAMVVLLAENMLGVTDHGLQCFVGLFRVNDLHHFHFVELVLANQSTGIAAIATRLGTKAR